MRVFLTLLVLFLSWLTDTNKFQEVNFEIADSRSTAQVLISIANNGSAVVTVTSANGTQKKTAIKVTGEQLKRLQDLLEEADIASIDSNTFEKTQQQLARPLIKIELVDKKSNEIQHHTIETTLDNYGNYRDELTPLVDFFLHEKFQPAQPAKMEVF